MSSANEKKFFSRKSLALGVLFIHSSESLEADMKSAK